MTAVPGPDPEELRRLIEERLGPIREVESEAHVAARPLGQDRLERLTGRRAWDRDDRVVGSEVGQAFEPDAGRTERDGVRLESPTYADRSRSDRTESG
jgi:hypothetical protein